MRGAAGQAAPERKYAARAGAGREAAGRRGAEGTTTGRHRSDRGTAGETELRAADEVRALLDRHGLRPQKGFGQNFLRDARYLRRIVEAAELTADDTVVEVGPGLGHLTRELSARAGRVIAIEIDHGLAALLRETLAPLANVQLVESDVLETDVPALVGGSPYKLVANLPYYITSPVLRHFIEESPVHPKLVVVMVQREVAERMLAKAGDMNLLAVSVQVFGRPRVVTFVPAQAFYPTPKVDSAVVRIDVYERPRVASDLDTFFRVTHAGFSQARKQLHNSLSQRLSLPGEAVMAALEAARVEPQRRPQTLSVEEWDRVTRELVNQGLLQ